MNDFKWIDVRDEKPREVCLAYLEEELWGSRVHVMSVDFNVVAGMFVWDAPKVLFWMPIDSLLN